MTSCTGSVGRGFLGSEKKQGVEFLPPNERVEIQTRASRDDFVCYGRRALVGLRADDVKAVSIERLCVCLSLSPHVEKNFNSKVIKFRTWTNFVNVVYFGLTLSISHIRILWYVTNGFVDLHTYMALSRVIYGGARGVMVIIVGNGHGDSSSNPERDWLHFT